MAILEIKKYPDPILRKKTHPVREISDEILRISKDMIETMKAKGGIGLAANQVGFTYRVVVVDGIEKNQPTVVLNPELIACEGEEIKEEGCLSIPGYFEFLSRFRRVLVRGVNLEGKDISVECEGIIARAFQHEIDHLNGILFIDRLSPVKRSLFRKTYQVKER